MFDHLSAPARGKKLPDEIYLSLVRSLYDDFRTMLVGAFGTVLAASITAARTGQAEFLACTLAILAVSILRMHDMRRFKARQRAPLDRATARHWEIRYLVGASAYVFLMGIWCLLAFALTADPGVQLLAFSMTLVNMIGAAGRNFSSRSLVIAQLACAGIPMLLSLLLMGSLYYAIVACVLAPFFVAFLGIADKLRGTLTSAVSSAVDVQLLAGRLNAALNNMMHGLCVIDGTGAIPLHNQQLPEILGIGKNGRLDSASSLLRALKAQGLLSAGQARQLIRQVRDRIGDGNDAPITVPLRDCRTLAVRVRAMEDGKIVAVTEDISDRVATEEKIRDLAYLDHLTGLPNRMLLREWMRQNLPQHGAAAPCAVLFIDLDHFKQVNDALGHRSGDKLLCRVAARLRELCSNDHLIARFGGDEFVVVGAPLSVGEAEVLAGRIIEKIGRPYDVDGHHLIIGASIGIALSPAHSRDPDELLRYADLALYEAKRQGRGVLTIFDGSISKAVEARRVLEGDLRQALVRRELEVHYQPIVGSASGRIEGCEALVRWRHPERGWISPAEFIPLAENIGMIKHIGRWVLRRACEDAVKWPSECFVAVNLSPYQFHDQSLVTEVLSALGDAGLAPERLELEITEDLLLQECPQTKATIEELRRTGIQVAMDDFGIGYSSLSYLKNFSFDKIKIDRSFIRDVPDGVVSSAIVHAAIQLARHLQMRVTAEGVETTAQMEMLRSAGCDEMQGFLFGHPQSLDQLLLNFEFKGTSVLEAMRPAHPQIRATAGPAKQRLQLDTSGKVLPLQGRGAATAT